MERTSIRVNSSDLSIEGYSTLATKAGDHTLNAKKIDTPAAKEELRKLTNALKEDTQHIKGLRHEDFATLLQEVQNIEKDEGDEGKEKEKDEGDDEGKGKDDLEPVEVPKSVSTAAAAARARVKEAFGDIKSTEYHNYLSLWRRLKSVIPGMEVSTIRDVEDVKNQSEEYVSGLIDYLEEQASNDKMQMDFSTTPWDKAPGWYPTGSVTKFTDKDDKNQKIKEFLDKITATLEGEKAWGNTANWILGIGGFYLTPKLGWKLIKFGLSKTPVIGTALGAGAEALQESSSEGRGRARRMYDWSKSKVVSKLESHKAAKTAKALAPTAPAPAPAAPPPVPAPAPAAFNIPSNHTFGIPGELDLRSQFELDLRQRLLRELYNIDPKAHLGTVPLGLADPIPQPFADSIDKGTNVDLAGKYARRIERLQDAWTKHGTDPQKINNLFNSIIKGKNPLNYQSTTSVAAQNAQNTINTATSRTTISIGSESFSVPSNAQKPLEDLQRLEERYSKVTSDIAKLEKKIIRDAKDSNYPGSTIENNNTTKLSSLQTELTSIHTKINSNLKLLRTKFSGEIPASWSMNRSSITLDGVKTNTTTLRSFLRVIFEHAAKK